MAGPRSFTVEEDIHILEVLFEAKAFYDVKGNQFWKDFEALGTTTRTWQALKQRFLKEIIVNIFNPKYKIPEYKKRIIYVAFKQMEQKKEDTNE